MAKLVEVIVLVAIPQTAFMSWLKKLNTQLEIEPVISPALIDKLDLYPNAYLYLIPPFENMDDAEKYISDHYQEIAFPYFFQCTTDKRFWPKDFNYSTFKEYFDLELHSRFYDLSTDTE